MKARPLPPHQRRQAERRKCWAGLLCAMWLVGFDLAPTAHIALHAHLTAHDHGHGGGHTHAAHTPELQPAQTFSGWRGHGAAHSDPSKHLALHVAPVDASRAEHVGAGHAHPHDDGGSAPGAGGGEAHDEASQGESPLDHGDGSLAHRDLAALLPLPGLPPVPEAPFMGWLPATPHRELAGNARPTATRARAPPEPTDIRHFT